MDDLKRLLSDLELQLQDLQVTFDRITMRAGAGGATVEEWARIARAGLVFNRLRDHRLILVQTIARLARTMEAAGLIPQV